MYMGVRRGGKRGSLPPPPCQAKLVCFLNLYKKKILSFWQIVCFCPHPLLIFFTSPGKKSAGAHVIVCTVHKPVFNDHPFTIGPNMCGRCLQIVVVYRLSLFTDCRCSDVILLILFKNWKWDSKTVGAVDRLLLNPIQIHHKYVIDNPNPIFKLDWQFNPNPITIQPFLEKDIGQQILKVSWWSHGIPKRHLLSTHNLTVQLIVGKFW